MHHARRHKLSFIAWPILLLAGASAACASPSSSEARGAGVTPVADPQNRPHQDQVIGRTESEKAAFDKFVENESRFKDHYQSHYTRSGYEYNQYRPAYQHGFELALDKRYTKMEWGQLELQARKTWDESTMGLWDRYKDAVRYGWDQGVALDHR